MPFRVWSQLPRIAPHPVQACRTCFLQGTWHPRTRITPKGSYSFFTLQGLTPPPSERSRMNTCSSLVCSIFYYYFNLPPFFRPLRSIPLRGGLASLPSKLQGRFVGEMTHARKLWKSRPLPIRKQNDTSNERSPSSGIHYQHWRFFVTVAYGFIKAFLTQAHR